MNASSSLSTIPASWLKRAPEGYTLPIWRWVLLPATSLMLKYNGGVWITGDLTLTEAELRFTQSKALPLKKAAPEGWTLSLSDIAAVRFTKGVVSETIEIDCPAGTHKILSARSEPFIALLRSRLPGI